MFRPPNFANTIFSQSSLAIFQVTTFCAWWHVIDIFRCWGRLFVHLLVLGGLASPFLGLGCG